VSADEIERDAEGEEGVEESDEVCRRGASLLEFSVEDGLEGVGVDVFWEVVVEQVSRCGDEPFLGLADEGVCEGIASF
jgi:hypothetical protein